MQVNAVIPRKAVRAAAPPRIMGMPVGVFISKVVILAILTVGACVVMLPLAWMISTSLKPAGQVAAYPIIWIPKPILWENYPKALTFIPFFKYTLNTLKIVFWTTLGVLLSCSLVAYGFARFRAPGLDVLFLVLLSTIMLPSQVTLIPVFILFSKMGWIDTLKPLIIPAFFGNAYDIFLLRQFFMTIPLEMDDAARIDGCGPFGIYWRIILPLSKPAVATVAIFHFMWAWNDFFNPLIYLHHRDNWTLALGLSSFRQLYETRVNLLMAASFVAVLPCILLFFFAQRLFIQGIVVSGVKG